MEDKYSYKIIVTAIIFNKKGQFLLAKRSTNEEVLPSYWGIPGGKVEANADCSDVLQLELKREIKEEVGLEIDNFKFIENHLHAESRKVHICFSADLKKGKPIASDETDEVGWYTIKEAETLKLTPFTLERLHIATSQRECEK